MSGHTPGPWMAEGPSKPSPDAPLGGDYAILDGGTNIIAETFRQVSADSVRPAKANARLIAAAPDLLEMLRVVERYFDTEEPHPILQADISAAIAKATGEQP